MGTFDDLINQVDAFIRKYYKNLMIKGVLLFLIIFLFTFFIVTGLEFVGRFNSFVRGFLLFSFIGLNGYVLFKFFIIPASKLFSFGKRINRYQAAKIIGDFFPSVNDRLLNTLQLQDASSSNPKNIELIQASIQQNAKQLNAFSFSSAIDYSANRRFLKYFIPILLTLVLVGIMVPNIFSEGSERLMKYNQVFEIAPDFTFELQNENLTVQEGSELEIKVLLKPLPGKALPDRVYLETSEGTFLMNMKSKNLASYSFSNLNSDVDFHFKATNAQSNSHSIHVVKRTSLGYLKVDIEYPKYLNRNTETIDNPGDLILPEGAKLTWNGLTKNAKSLTVILPDSSLRFPNSPGFRFAHTLKESSNLIFILENQELSSLDSLDFHIDVIKDEYPSISVNKREDSLTKNKVYFSGSVNDDYGLSQLIFTYSIEKESGEKQSKNISVPGIDGKQSPFSMTFNLDELRLELKDKVTYFFTVYDNDGVRGPKATKSNIFQYVSPSLEELQEKRSDEKDKATEDLKELIRESQEFKEQMARLKKEIANSKKSTWQQQKQVESLQEQQKSLENKIKQIKDQMKSSFEEKSKLSPMDEKLLEKQKQIEDLLDSIMDDELKKLLEELEKMLNNNEDKNILEKMEEGEMSAEDMERQLDRTMEMLKKMDVEERVEDLQKSLDQLSKEQDKLKEDLDKGLNKEDAEKQQQDLNEKFDKIKEDLDEMLKKNEDLKRPLSFEGMDKMAEEISQDMKNAKEEIQKENSKSAKEKQQSASEKMQEAASQLQAQMEASQEEQDGEDLKAMRALLENLMRLSFIQEDNMLAFQETDIYDPMFVSLGKSQRGIIDNLKPVKDSLRALADRVPKISSFIEQELNEIEKQYRYIPSHIGERESRQLATKQQFAMTGINNLALFLNEALESAQQDMQSKKSGKGSCSKPGQGKPGQGSPGDMEGMKEMIKKQLEQMKKGNNPGGQKPGEKPGGMLPMSSQQAAKMAAEQGALQKKLQELKEQMNKDGSGEGNKLNDLLKELEKQEEDLINKNWSSELIDRQQEILTRLLESENAIRERGLDEERESKSGKDENIGNQIEFLEYKNQKEKQIELLRTLDPSFSKYYKEKANAYFLNVN
ncbi:MAG TPA: hypothetical protein VFD77_03975 [Brumimicrobium sp.]|nr:hypothetical protein [Brumimicrobium sp.]